MHQLLLDYWNRFNLKKKTNTITTFFSQHPLPKTTNNWNQIWQNMPPIPYLMDIEIFCARLYLAKIKKQKICVYSDYDTDAVTATAVMVKGLEMLGFEATQISFYAPDRFIEGYGLNVEAIQKLCLQNDLIISVDCGINSVKEAEIASQSKCNLIITDHHHLTGEIPKATAVINPRLKDVYENQTKQNPFLLSLLQELEKCANLEIDYNNLSESKTILQDWLSSSVTGVGVAWFCLVWLSYFLQSIEGNTNPKLLNQLLPFVAIGTVADCQSVLETTNRLLIKAGLQRLQNYPAPTLGLAQIIKQTGIEAKIEQNYQLTSQDLAFILSPILNASGRISHASLSINTLLANQAEQAKILASQLIQTNQQRKTNVKEVLEQIENLAKKQIDNKQPLIWLQGPWNKGLVGLLASRLVSEYNLPCIVIAIEENQTSSASLRAPEGFNLPEAMKSAITNQPNLFEKFGGHPCAAGFSCKTENLMKIKKGMTKAINQQRLNLNKLQAKSNQVLDKLAYKIKIDDPTNQSILNYINNQNNLIYIESEQITNILEQIWQLDPFGQDFPMPNLVFIINSYQIKSMGQENQYLKIILPDGCKITFFNLEKDLSQSLAKSPTLLVIAKPVQNSWNGETTTELIGHKISIVNQN